jgi:hypothetical protein
MIVTGVGFGIAQAAGIHSEQPVLRLEDMEAAQEATSPAEDSEQSSPATRVHWRASGNVFSAPTGGGSARPSRG